MRGNKADMMGLENHRESNPPPFGLVGGGVGRLSLTAGCLLFLCVLEPRPVLRPTTRFSFPATATPRVCALFVDHVPWGCHALCSCLREWANVVSASSLERQCMLCVPA
ncbi:hypothetical protein MLD38_039181 [Melastoma candidum]|uniref:Uncharacterized protein n=1 Tax=Melastoma candidum TaxID=119954 RepID=A0ACB9L207_9MYRT|nr:hypothetical protein MLD38_039181 [Melastoma candidum]